MRVGGRENKNIAGSVGDGRWMLGQWFEKQRGGFRSNHRDAQYRWVSMGLGLGCGSFLDVVCYTSLLWDLGVNVHLLYQELEMWKERGISKSRLVAQRGSLRVVWWSKNDSSLQAEGRNEFLVLLVVLESAERMTKTTGEQLCQLQLSMPQEQPLFLTLSFLSFTG